MAEVASMRNNALPYPVYAQAWVIEFPLLDADGDPISPSSPDSEVSKNGDTFADCTNEAVEIATSTGVCYLILTAAEMTADIVGVRIQSTGAKTTIVTLNPRKLVVLSSGTCQGSNDTGDIQLASGDSAVDDYYNGCLVVAVIDTVTEARIINDYVGSTKVGEISPAWVQAAPDSNDTYTIYLPEGRQVNQANATHWNSLVTVALPLIPATAGRSLVVDAAGLADANMVKAGPTAAGTAQTARDIGASVLLSSGTGTGQVKIASGYLAMTWADIAAPTTTQNLSGTTIKTATDLATAIDAVDNFIDTEIADIQGRLPAALTASGNMKSDALAIGGNTTVPTNMIVVFSTDFAANYNTTLDQWSVNVESWNATAVPAEHTAGYPIVTVKDGTGTGEINTNAGKVVGVELVDVLTTYTGNTPQTGDSFLRLTGTGAVTFASLTVSGGTTLSGAVSLGSTLGITGAITATNASNNLTLGTLTVTTNAMAWNASWDAEVQSECADALVAYDGLVGADLPTNFAALSITAGGIVKADLDTIKTQTVTCGAVVTILASVGTAATSTAQTGDSFARIGVTGSGLTTLATQASVDDLPTNAELATSQAAADDATLAAIAALNNLSQANIRTAIGLASANLDTQLADLPTVAEFEARTLLAAAYGTAANQTTIAAFIDTEVASILAAVDTEIAAIITTLGVAGAGLTALGDTRLANLDTAVSTRATPAQVNTEVLDVLNVDTLIDGKTFVQAVQYVGAICAGRVSGAGTGTEVFKGLDESTTRVTITVDGSGNRTDIVYG